MLKATLTTLATSKNPSHDYSFHQQRHASRKYCSDIITKRGSKDFQYRFSRRVKTFHGTKRQEPSKTTSSNTIGNIKTDIQENEVTVPGPPLEPDCKTEVFPIAMTFHQAQTSLHLSPSDLGIKEIVYADEEEEENGDVTQC